MATVLGLASYRMLDDDGVSVAKEIYFTFDDTKTLANIHSFMQTLATALDAVTNAEITNMRFEINLSTSGLKSAPVAGNGDDDILLTDYVQSGSFYHWGDAVPALIDALLVGGKIDLTNTNLTAYVAALTTAASGFQAAGRFGNVLVALTKASKRDRKQRKQITARSTSIP